MKTCVRCGVPFILMAVPCSGHPPYVKVRDTWPQLEQICMVVHEGWRCPVCRGDVYE